MAPEHYVDPEVGQALEQVRQALRAERDSLGPLASQNAELRERAQRLETERNQLRDELARLRQGRPGAMPRLPEVLEPPFEVRPLVPRRRLAREALPVLIIMSLALSVWLRKDGMILGFFVYGLLMMVGRFFSIWRGLPRWGFVEAGIRAKETEVPGGLVRYEDLLRVEAHSSNWQRLRGVGSVWVTYKAAQGEEKLLMLKNVPEPERLAEWLQSKRSGPTHLPG